MARSRNIKPSTSENELLAKLSAHTRLLFALLPCHADCEGKLEDRPERLHIKIFPYEPKLKMDKMLNDLHDKKFITRYEVDGEKYIWINKFLDHQSPNMKEREKGSNIPDFDQNSHGTKQEHDRDNTGSALTLNPKPLTLNPNTELVHEISQFYKDNINSVEIPSGKRNLEKIHKEKKIPLQNLFQCVKNYKRQLDISNTETRFKIRMRNFFGRDARYEDYKDAPTQQPQNTTSHLKHGEFDTPRIRKVKADPNK